MPATGLPGIDEGAVPGYASPPLAEAATAHPPPMCCGGGGCMRRGDRWCTGEEAGLTAAATAVSTDSELRGELPPDAWRCMSSGLFSSNCGGGGGRVRARGSRISNG